MSFFEPPPKPQSAMGYHRILSPTASVKVSPLCLGGISIGNSWSELFGCSQDAFSLLDAFLAMGGNFIDTANTYNAEESENLIGEWMEARGVRDQMVIATKYTAGYRAYNREKEPMQSNFTGNSAKSMHVSVRDSLKKLRTDYIDILYVHWWDFATSVEEIMTHLHALVMNRKVLYLGVSDTPAWVVVKANEFARRNGLTPFSVYQGRWNAAFRDMEAEIIPMCEDQGMAVVAWAALGGGQLISPQERKRRETDPNAPKAPYGLTERELAVSEALERISAHKGTTIQAIALAYLFHQTPYCFPIVGVQTTEHVQSMPDALKVMLSEEDMNEIHRANPFDPLFPMNFLFNTETQPYNLRLNASNHHQYRMAAWISAPPKQLPYTPHDAYEDYT